MCSELQQAPLLLTHSCPRNLFQYDWPSSSFCRRSPRPPYLLTRHASLGLVSFPVTKAMTFTIVICPGAWPLVEFFEPLKQAFQAKNHTAICRIPSSYPDVIPHTLPSVNPDAKYLRSHVLEPLIDEGRDIVLYAHSYGGVYGPAALEGLSKKERQAKGLEGGVIGVILNAAFIAPKGTTAMAAMRVDPMSLPEWIRYDVSRSIREV